MITGFGSGQLGRMVVGRRHIRPFLCAVVRDEGKFGDGSVFILKFLWTENDFCVMIKETDTGGIQNE